MDKTVIDLSSRAQDSSRAILWIRSDIEISQGHEAICTVRPWEPFRPERLAIHVSCAESFDLIDFRVALCSVLGSEDAAPAIRYAVKYKVSGVVPGPGLATGSPPGTPVRRDTFRPTDHQPGLLRGG